MTNLNAATLQALTAELANLRLSHNEALKDAAFIPMTVAQAKAYESQLVRMREICEILSAGF